MGSLRPALDLIQSLLHSSNGYFPLGVLLFVLEVPLCIFILSKVPYTEIDWIAYMQEVEHFLNGTLDYDQIQGQTGPCVYPAGFLYVYSLFYWMTSGGSDILSAQYGFMAIYLTTLILVLNVYRVSKQAPPYALMFTCIIAYRVHSIYLLRLFNDPLAMLAVYGCICFLLMEKFTIACILFSCGLAIKMNVLLFLPGLLITLLWFRGVLESIGHLCEILLVQLVLGAPFLFHNPGAYIASAFNFGRQFMYKWTVNWRLLSENVFLDRRFHLALLCLHFLFLFALLFHFVRSRGGIMSFLELHNPGRSPRKDQNGVVYPIFVSNFVGIVFSRSLHYQFYVWYFHTLVFLLWSVDRFSSPVRLLVLGLIEICWNTYPSTVFSSALLHCCHAILLFGLLFSSVPYNSLTGRQDSRSCAIKPTNRKLMTSKAKQS